MAITMGFVLRVDSYPLAAPLPPQAVAARPAVIEAQAVVEPTAITRHDANRRAAALAPLAAMPAAPIALTYSVHGAAQTGADSGRLLDIYA